MSQHIHIGKTLTILLSLIFVSIAIPTSVLEELITKDIANKKVKRAQGPPAAAESVDGSQKEYFYPTATKRSGSTLKTNQLPLLSEWDQQRYREQVEGLPSPLYSPLEDVDDKSIAEYVKGYRYATNRDKLDELLENAVLKSEMYGNPAALNHYRYYGLADSKRRRRNVMLKTPSSKQKSQKLKNRLKRDADLSPDDILAILALWENERQNGQNRRQWQNVMENDDYDTDSDEGWLDVPVSPHASEERITPASSYYYDVGPRYYEKRGRWNGFTGNHHKRFMVSRKRSDPTRGLRFLSEPSSHTDYYTLNELLANKRDPAVPIYQRYML